MGNPYSLPFLPILLTLATYLCNFSPHAEVFLHFMMIKTTSTAKKSTGWYYLVLTKHIMVVLTLKQQACHFEFNEALLTKLV